MISHKKASKLLLLLGEYFGFSILCGWGCFLFFIWTSRVISNNYVLKTGVPIAIQTEYWMNLVCIFVGIFIAAFVLVLLLQKKFSYILRISSTVEQMEAGDLSKRIPLEGEDELTELALSINHLADAMSENLKRIEDINDQRVQTVAVLSHDLRTPLTAVMSYLQFIKDGQYTDNHQLRLYAERAFDKANCIKDLSDSLFNRCISDAEKTEPLERVEGSMFFSNALRDIENFLVECGFAVQIESPLNSCAFYVSIDYHKMTRVFENLISNIRKYADCQYPVKFELALTENEVLLRQVNKVLGKQEKEVESHLLGLKSVETSLMEMGGFLGIRNEHNYFTLEIHLPISDVQISDVQNSLDLYE